MHLACRSGNLHAAAILLKTYGIKVLSYKNKSTGTPLHDACLSGHTEVVEKIINSLNYFDKDCLYKYLMKINSENKTPLHLACHEGHFPIVKKILQESADEDRDKLLRMTDNEGNLPFHLACVSENEEIVQELIVYYREIVKDHNEAGLSPLHIVAAMGNVKLATLLINGYKRDNVSFTGIDKNIVDASNWTPLHFAAKNGHTEMVKSLINE